ncbi:MAG TPA: tetratricopeptide repeat protein, partial [Myxococcota bacterium]|nr:tetratricopeptide repeat protein [Myxococcota bacterium]
GIRLGLLIFVVLLGLVAGQFTWRYMTRANRLNDEAVDLMNQDKYEAAMTRLDEALAIDPNHFLASYHRALCRAERHMWEDSLADFDHALSLRPDEPRANFNRGKLLWTLGRFEEAHRSLLRATELDHQAPEPWLLLGECEYELFLKAAAAHPGAPGSPAAAVAALKTYLRLETKPADRRAVEQKLEILEHLDKYPEVLERRAPPPVGGEAHLEP